MKPLSRWDIIASMLGGAIMYRVMISIHNGQWLYAAVGIVLVFIIAIVVSGDELAYQLRDVNSDSNRRELMITPCFDQDMHEPHSWTLPHTGFAKDVEIPVYQCPGKDYI